MLCDEEPNEKTIKRSGLRKCSNGQNLNDSGWEERWLGDRGCDTIKREGMVLAEHSLLKAFHYLRGPGAGERSICHSAPAWHVQARMCARRLKEASKIRNSFFYIRFRWSELEAGASLLESLVSKGSTLPWRLVIMRRSCSFPLISSRCRLTSFSSSLWVNLLHSQENKPSFVVHCFYSLSFSYRECLMPV